MFSDCVIRSRQYQQEVVSVMTTQEPDKVCKTSIRTLTFETADPVKDQMFIQCFTFDQEPVQLQYEEGGLLIGRGGRTYRFGWKEDQTSFRIAVTEAGKAERNYQIQ